MTGNRGKALRKPADFRFTDRGNRVYAFQMRWPGGRTVIRSFARGKAPLVTGVHVLGRTPYRMALAGGWIDQPFVSQRQAGEEGLLPAERHRLRGPEAGAEAGPAAAHQHRPEGFLAACHLLEALNPRSWASASPMNVPPSPIPYFGEPRL